MVVHLGTEVLNVWTLQQQSEVIQNLDTPLRLLHSDHPLVVSYLKGLSLCSVVEVPLKKRNIKQFHLP